MTYQINIKLIPFAIIFLLFTTHACVTTQVEKEQVLRHVVLLQFKDEVDEERRKQAVQDFLDIKAEIPEIKKIEGGDDVSAGTLNKGFTHSFVLTFESVADREVYLPHPAHVALVNKNKPLLQDLMVMEFWSRP